MFFKWRTMWLLYIDFTLYFLMTEKRTILNASDTQFAQKAFIYDEFSFYFYIVELSCGVLIIFMNFLIIII